jgi:hypothetical protein
LGKFSQKTTVQNLMKDPEMLGPGAKALKNQAMTFFRGCFRRPTFFGGIFPKMQRAK